MSMKIPNSFEDRFALVFWGRLTEDARQYVQQIVGYLAKAKLSHIEGLLDHDFEWFDYAGNSVVIVNIDLTKADRYPTPDFFEDIQNYLTNGSPPYKRAMRGKPVGFQLIPAKFNGGLIITNIITDDPEDNGRGMTEDEFRLTVNKTIGRVRTLEVPTPEQVEQSFEGVTPGEDLKVTVPTGAKRITITIDF